MIILRTPRGERVLELDEFEAEVRGGRVRPGTPVRVPVVTGERWVRARDLELFQRIYAPARIRFAESFSLGRFPRITFALCLAQVALFLALGQGARVLGLDLLIAAGAKVHANVLELGETWRLLVANVLHRDLLHLGFNTFFLFNAGGAIENTFRARDYALVLVASALGTTVTSVALSLVPSVGSSGIVLGLFGSASVFGYRYGELLPPRYRRYFGGAVLPYALFIVYVGLSSRDTDNWGHVGGLLFGAIATLPLYPRLLVPDDERWPSRIGPAAASLALVLVVLAVGPVLRAWGPPLERVEDAASGIAFAHPVRWESGENHLGDPAWGNRLGVSIGVRAERRDDLPFTLEGMERGFLREVRALERSGEVAGVERLSKRPFLIEGGRGLELEIRLESRAGPQHTRNLLVERGHHAYRIVLTSPRAFAAAYGPVLERLVRALELIETTELRRAIRVAETFPGMSSAQVELGDRLASLGEVDAAATAYRRALESVPDLPEAMYGLARLTLVYGGDVEAAERASTALWTRRPDVVAFVTLVADLRWRLGRPDAACAVLQSALDRLEAPPEPVRQRLVELRCPGGAWIDR